MRIENRAFDACFFLACYFLGLSPIPPHGSFLLVRAVVSIVFDACSGGSVKGGARVSWCFLQLVTDDCEARINYFLFFSGTATNGKVLISMQAGV